MPVIISKCIQKLHTVAHALTSPSTESRLAQERPRGSDMTGKNAGWSRTISLYTLSIAVWEDIRRLTDSRKETQKLAHD